MSADVASKLADSQVAHHEQSSVGWPRVRRTLLDIQNLGVYSLISGAVVVGGWLYQRDSSLRAELAEVAVLTEKVSNLQETHRREVDDLRDRISQLHFLRQMAESSANSFAFMRAEAMRLEKSRITDKREEILTSTRDAHP